ncbi:MAG TPA: VOC family protein [Candidatus Methylomirabilis sp.]|nr:VOC family protein [Candidatus Methylomirabilis sp.]
MQLARLDHLVLTVRNLDVSVDFYVRVLGMSLQTFDKDRKALRFGSQKINLHESGKEFEPKAHHPTPGSADLCFVVETPLPEVVDHVRGQGGEILLGPVQRTGAEGPMESVYLRDPDGNLIELSRYRTD